MIFIYSNPSLLQSINWKWVPREVNLLADAAAELVKVHEVACASRNGPIGLQPPLLLCSKLKSDGLSGPP